MYWEYPWRNLAVASSGNQVSFAAETSQYRLCTGVPAALPALIVLRRNWQASLAWGVSYCFLLPSLKSIKSIINNRDHVCPLDCNACHDGYHYYRSSRDPAC